MNTEGTIDVTSAARVARAQRLDDADGEAAGEAAHRASDAEDDRGREADEVQAQRGREVHPRAVKDQETRGAAQQAARDRPPH